MKSSTYYHDALSLAYTGAGDWSIIKTGEPTWTESK